MQAKADEVNHAEAALFPSLPKDRWNFPGETIGPSVQWRLGELLSDSGHAFSVKMAVLASSDFNRVLHEVSVSPIDVDAIIAVDAGRFLNGAKYAIKAVWVNAIGTKFVIARDAEEWHGELLPKLEDPDGPQKGDKYAPPWTWFRELVSTRKSITLEPTTSSFLVGGPLYQWVDYKVSITDKSGRKSKKIQLLIAQVEISESMVASFNKMADNQSMYCLLICNDFDFSVSNGARFCFAGPGYKGGDAALPLARDDDLAEWFVENASVVFDEQVETITVAENDLTPTHDGPDPDPKLGFKEIAVELHRTIEAVRESAREGGVDPSITIGLFGPWGSGKSTLLGALEDRLRKSGAEPEGAEFDLGVGHYDIIEVNAWKWDGSKSLAAHMLDRVLAVMGPKLEEHAKKKGLGQGWYARFLKFTEHKIVPALPVLLLLVFLGFAGVWIWGAVIKPMLTEGAEEAGGISWLFPVLTAIVGALSKVFQDTLKDIFGKLFQREVVKVTDQQKLEKTYAEIQEVSRATDRTLAFFIDDLDRCTPERVGEFVESIHNLTSAGCVTIVACDEEYVAAALNARYADIVAHHPDGNDFGRGFLEKIVQVGFRMPALTDAGVREAGLIGRGAAGADTEKPAVANDTAPIPASVDGPAPSDDVEGEGAGDAEDGAEKDEGAPRTKIDTKLVSDTLDEMVADFVQPLGINMRRVKALRNTVGLYLRVAAARGDLGPEDHGGAARIAAFLVADLLDRVWLDAYRLGQDEDYAKRPGLGAFSGREGLLEELRVALGKASELDDLYRLLGRRARPLPPVKT
jgi:hypothetical protein